jgi:hypothetical protein
MMAELSKEANGRIREAWAEVQVALQDVSDNLAEDREEFNRLLNALMGLKMALEIEQILEGDGGDA